MVSRTCLRQPCAHRAQSTEMLLSRTTLAQMADSLAMKRAKSAGEPPPGRSGANLGGIGLTQPQLHLLLGRGNRHLSPRSRNDLRLRVLARS